jgi:valyl-tRNA synthetase
LGLSPTGYPVWHLTPATPAARAAGAPRALAGVSGELQVLLPIEGLVDLDALRGLLEKDIAKAEKEIAGLSGRLANPNFAGKAQAELARQRLGDLG